MDSDHACIDRCLAGDPAAFDDIVRRYQGALYRHLLRLAGSREQAEDLCQEAFIKLYRALPGFERGRTVAPLLFKIATNLWRDGRPDPLEMAGLGNPDSPDPSRRVADQVVLRLEHEAIRQALQRLRSEYREVLSLRYDQGLSYREIAEVTGVSVGTVGTRLRRAVDALRAVLADHREEEVAR
jgi:RNA polymerase sigma-70 factor (ECF subfamily)